jgi:hypothetical protein
MLLCDRQDAENQARASVLLDNADGDLTALAQDPESCGDRVSLDFGYVTSAGAEFSGAAPLFVTAVQLAAQGGSATCTLLCHDAWYLLAAWRPRRLYLFTQTSILHLVQWILARCGIPLVTPGSPSAALSRTPNASLGPSHTAAHALHALLDQVPEVLRFTAQGAVLSLPQAGDAPVYSYTPGSHPVLASRLTTAPPSLTHVLLYGKSTPTDVAPALIAESVDAPAALRFGDLPHTVTDMQILAADAGARAAVALRKAQMIQDAGEIAAFPNAGLELWDPVAVTDPPTGQIAALRRVRALHTRYDALSPGGVYTQSVGLMNP